MNATGSSALPLRNRVLFFLTLALCIRVGVFAIHAVSFPSARGMHLSVLGLAVLALVTLFALWRAKDWGPWSALALLSGTLTLDVYGWSTGVDRIVSLVSAAIAAAMIILIFQIGQATTRTVTLRMRSFYAIIIFFPAWVGTGGLFFTARIEDFLPFNVPPLHARFIGAMYAAGATMMLFATLARAWHEVRVVTLILGIWTGVLGVVSLLYLGAFNWTASRPTWFWWFAYIWFPLGAAFLFWNQRGVQDHPDEAPLSLLLRAFLVVQGAIAVALALTLLFSPATMIALWPWRITPLLAQIYSAPFLAYGLGSLYAARQHGWSEVRGPVMAIVVLTAVAVIGSFVHSATFNAVNPSTWVWFGGLGLVAIGLAALAASPRLRSAASS
jgi:hypothetical protein